MDLDVAAFQRSGSQHVSVGQRDTETVVGTRFAVIENDDMITDLAVQISLCGAADITMGSAGVDLSIPGDRQTAHMQFDIVVDKVHVPKELVVLHPATRPKLAWSLESSITNPPPVAKSHGLGMMWAFANALVIIISPARSVRVAIGLWFPKFLIGALLQSA